MGRLALLLSGIVIGAGSVVGVNVVAAPGDPVVRLQLSGKLIDAATIAHVEAISRAIFTGEADSFCMTRQDEGGWAFSGEGGSVVPTAQLPTDQPYTIIGRVAADGTVARNKRAR